MSTEAEGKKNNRERAPKEHQMSSKVSSEHMDMCQSWDRLQAL